MLMPSIFLPMKLQETIYFHTVIVLHHMSLIVQHPLVSKIFYHNWGMNQTHFAQVEIHTDHRGNLAEIFTSTVSKNDVV